MRQPTKLDAALPALHVAVVVLTAQGAKGPEVAQELGLEAAHVRQILCRARALLQSEPTEDRP